MSRRPTNSQPGKLDALVLRTFAFLVGAMLSAGGVGVLANALWHARVSGGFRMDAVAAASVAAVVLGAVLVYWGIRRRQPRAAASEEVLSKLVRKYERQGKTRELEDAREQLIQLLVEKDEPDSMTPK